MNSAVKTASLNNIISSASSGESPDNNLN